MCIWRGAELAPFQQHWQLQVHTSCVSHPYPGLAACDDNPPSHPPTHYQPTNQPTHPPANQPTLFQKVQQELVSAAGQCCCSAAVIVTPEALLSQHLSCKVEGLCWCVGVRGCGGGEREGGCGPGRRVSAAGPNCYSSPACPHQQTPYKHNTPGTSRGQAARSSGRGGSELPGVCRPCESLLCWLRS